MSITWNELKKKSKELGYKEITKYHRYKEVIALVNENLYGFYPDGTVETDCFQEDDLCGMPIAYDRTPEQMLMLMVNLFFLIKNGV